MFTLEPTFVKKTASCKKVYREVAWNYTAVGFNLLSA